MQGSILKAIVIGSYFCYFVITVVSTRASTVTPNSSSKVTVSAFTTVVDSTVPPFAVTGRTKQVPNNTFVYWERLENWMQQDKYTDTTGCAQTCALTDDQTKADFLISLNSNPPISKNRARQYTVHFSRESLYHHGDHIHKFDLTMDMSPQSNIPISSVPANFWKTMHSMPIPTLAQVKKRKLAIWIASNCKSTEWDRIGWVKELTKYMQIDRPGSCLNNVKAKTSRAAFKSNAQIYSEYLFVFGLVNALDNRNFDEKVFQPFSGNAVPVIRAHKMVSVFAPGRHSYIDGAKYTPKALAEYLLYLQRHPREYLKYYSYRKTETKPPTMLEKIEQTSIYQTGHMCRICACKYDAMCMTKRNVTKAGYKETDFGSF